jgi:hypothetical protein
LAISQRQSTACFDTNEQSANSFEPNPIRPSAADVRLGVMPADVSPLTWRGDHSSTLAAQPRPHVGDDLLDGPMRLARSARHD